MNIRFFLLTILLSSYLPAATFSYQLIDLGIQNCKESYATSINEHGQIAGILLNEENKTHIYVWDLQKGVKTTSARVTTYPLITGTGEVYGSRLKKYREDAWEYDQDELYVWKKPYEKPLLVDLKSLGQPLEGVQYPLTPLKRNATWSVNDKGQVLIMNIGEFSQEKLNSLSLESPKIWIYDKKKYISLSKELTVGIKINNQSEVLGYFNKKTSIYNFEKRSSLFLHFPEDCEGKDLNDLSEIVGLFYNPSSQKIEGFFVNFSGPNFINLGNFSPEKLNNHQLMIGSYLEGEKKGKPAIWEHGALLDLSEVAPLIDNLGNSWESLDEIVALNDSGWLVGYGKLNGAPHGFLLLPCHGD